LTAKVRQLSDNSKFFINYLLKNGDKAMKPDRNLGADGGKRGADDGKGASDGEEAAADDGGIVMREMGY